MYDNCSFEIYSLYVFVQVLRRSTSSESFFGIIAEHYFYPTWKLV